MNTQAAAVQTFQQPTHLRQVTTGRLFSYTLRLSKRSDMQPINIDEAGNEAVVVAQKESVASHPVPADQQEAFMALERQLNDLERRYEAVVGLVETLQGGIDYLKGRKDVPVIQAPTTPVAQSHDTAGAPGVPGSMVSPPPGAVTTPGGLVPPSNPEAPEPGAPAAPADQASAVAAAASHAAGVDPAAVADANQVVGTAEAKVATQEQYLKDQETRLIAAGESLQEAEEAMETADESNKAAATSALEAAQKENKGAGIKVKSATTKLENARSTLVDAVEARDKLLAPAS